MSNLFGIGLSGLSAAQAALATSSNNISNVNTPGYNRQRAIFGQAPVSQGVGSGVLVTGVERQYQQFLAGQLRDAESRSSALDTHLSQMSQINNLLADSEAGLAPLMQQFFSGLQTLAASPADTAARQSLLGDANSMASQFRAFSDYLQNMQGSVELQLKGAIDQVNNYGQQIAQLNEQIGITQSRTGQSPNRLLDQRDRLVSELSQLVDVKLSIQDGNKYTLVVAGQPLVDASGAHSFELTESAENPNRQVIAYRTATGGLREIDQEQFTGGTIGGLVAFRNESLAPAQLRLDQLAHALATKVNEVHAAGFDLDGDTGIAFFETSQPVSYAHADNTGGASLDVSFNGQLTKVAATNYRVEYSGGQYKVTSLADGVTQTFSGAPIEIGGVEISVSGVPDAGDSFLVKPVANAAASLEVAVSHPADIAAAQGKEGDPTTSAGTGDNRNALALADLQNAAVVNGNSSFNSAYAQLVSDVGNATRSLQVNSTAQASLTGELQSAQQSVSGVNLDEERVNLLYYQQMYQANARVIQTAATLFDTLLRIV